MPAIIWNEALHPRLVAICGTFIMHAIMIKINTDDGNPVDSYHAILEVHGTSHMQNAF